MSNATSLSYRADIDGVRAVAVLLVVVFHFHLMPGVNSGFMGVDVFFVISGFLITAIVQRQLDANTFRVGMFWIHRIRRLAPALVATTLLTMIVGWLWLLPDDFAKLAEQTVATQLYFANIFYWRRLNYFGLHADGVYLLHTWSLAVEEQFYLLFPLTLLAISKWMRNRVGVALCALFLISFVLNLLFVGPKPEATFYLMPTRAWELLAGSLLALYVPKLRGDAPRAALVIGASGVALLVASIVTYDVDIRFPGVFALLPVAAGVLLILAGSAGPNAVTGMLRVRPLVYIGKISYPLYLVHWPVNVLATAAFGAGYAWGWRLAMLLLSVGLAIAIFHGVEHPARRWLERARSIVVLRSYGVALIGMVAMSVIVYQTTGVPSRYPERVARLASFASDTPPPLLECEYLRDGALKTQSLCSLGAKGVAPRWFVYGDSHAWAASGGIDQWLKQTGQSALFIFRHACPPVRGVYVFRGGSACHSFNAAALAYLKEQDSVTHVLLISTWRGVHEGELTDNPDRKVTPEKSLALFNRQLTATLTELNSMGKRTYIWEPLPGAKTSVPEAMARSELASAPLSIDFTRDEYLAEFAYFFAALREQGPLVAGTFSPARALCETGRCVSQIGGTPLYFDNAHLTYSLSGFWAKALATQMPSAGSTAPN